MDAVDRYLEKGNVNKKMLAYVSALSLVRDESPFVADRIVRELRDQRSNLKLIASENYSSLSVQAAMGNLLTDFKVPSDTVFIPGKDSTVIQKSVQKVEVERKLTSWQKFCMVFTVIVLILFAVVVVYKIRVILNKK